MITFEVTTKVGKGNISVFHSAIAAWTYLRICNSKHNIKYGYMLMVVKDNKLIHYFY